MPTDIPDQHQPQPPRAVDRRPNPARSAPPHPRPSKPSATLTPGSPTTREPGVSEYLRAWVPMYLSARRTRVAATSAYRREVSHRLHGRSAWRTHEPGVPATEPGVRSSFVPEYLTSRELGVPEYFQARATAVPPCLSTRRHRHTRVAANLAYRSTGHSCRGRVAATPAYRRTSGAGCRITSMAGVPGIPAYP